jgi:hypothetical protein
MGYFKQPIDRARSRAQIRRLNVRSCADIAWKTIPSRPPERACFVRFSTLDRHSESGRCTGLFTAAARILHDPQTDPRDAESLRAAKKWFDWFLISPDDVSDPRAIWFFKSSATECMTRAWRLIHHLREAGIVMEMQTVARPGKIVYEDDDQIAVVPWADANVR